MGVNQIMAISIIAFPSCCAFHILQNLPLQTKVGTYRYTKEQILELLTKEKKKVRDFFQTPVYMGMASTNMVCTLNHYQVQQGVGQVLKDEGYRLTDVQRNGNTGLLVYTYVRRGSGYSSEDMSEHFAAAA